MSNKKDEAQQQEPVAWYDAEKDCAYTLADCEGRAQDDLEPLYLEPPSKPWVGLNENELTKCIVEAGCLGVVKMSFETGPYDIDRPSINASKLLDAIEAKLREKNGLV